MNKIIVMILCMTIIASLVGCSMGEADPTKGGELSFIESGPAMGGQETQKENGNNDVSHQVSAEVLEKLGMTAEQFAALDPEVQKAILDEMGAVLGDNDKKPSDEKNPVTYTPADVMAGGKYVVVLGDYMNSITLYYENGVLVKLVENFQKNSLEEAFSATYEGQALKEYGFNFINWSDATLQEILDGMRNYGDYGNYTIRKAD